MAKEPCKGTVLQLEIASVFTTIAQVIEIDVGPQKSETFDADTLDNTSAGMPKDPTGRSSQDDISVTMFYDPALATHQFLTDTIAAPVKVDGKIIMADSGSSEATFTAAGLSFGATYRMNDGIKANLGIETDGLVSWPT